MSYQALRKDGGPTQFGEQKTPVTADVLEAGLIYAIVILTVAFLIVLPGFRGTKERIFMTIRILIGIFVLGSILLCNFGQEWDVAKIRDAETQYRANLREDIKADIGFKIGLRSVNITLKGKPVVQRFENGLVNETVDYNERFHWDNEGFQEGRFGFGPYASTLNQEFRLAQRRGLPYPILWIAEYFTLDEEGTRWERHYRQAGYYTHIVMWFAFPAWLLSLILFNSVIVYGAYFSLATGLSLLTANLLYANIRNPIPLRIAFGDRVLEPYFGWCFWLCLINGCLCFVIGILVIILHDCKTDVINAFFNVDVTQDVVEEYYLTAEDLGLKATAGRKDSKPPAKKSISNVSREPLVEENEIQDTNGTRADDQSGDEQLDVATARPMFRKREGPIGRIQKSIKRKEPKLSVAATPRVPSVERRQQYSKLAKRSDEQQEEDGGILPPPPPAPKVPPKIPHKSRIEQPTEIEFTTHQLNTEQDIAESDDPQPERLEKSPEDEDHYLEMES